MYYTDVLNFQKIKIELAEQLVKLEKLEIHVS